MATNVIDQWGRGIAQGLSLGQQMLRQQELRSQQALRQLQERQIAQTMAMQMEAHDLAIEKRAAMSKAMARVQMESMPMLPAPADGPPEAGGQQPTAFLPNPMHVPLEQSLITNVLPVLGQYGEPKEIGAFVSDVAMLPYRQAMTADEMRQTELRGLPSARTPEQIAADNALVEQRKSSAALNAEKLNQLKDGKDTTTPIIERKFQLYEEAVKAGNKTRIRAYENDLGLNNLTPSMKANYEAELDALERDFQNVTKPEEYLKRRMAIVKKYFTDTENAPSTSSTSTNRFRPNFKTGKLERIN